MLKTKDEVIKHKKQAIHQLNKTFEAYINNPDDKYLKRADLLSYWIEEYSDYLLKEKQFDYNRVLKLKRGQIISVNFGYNIGSEHGGLHYAMVLDNDNKQSSPVITVVPLSSHNGKDVNNRDVFLGSELHDKLLAKYTDAKNEYDKDKAINDKMIESLQTADPESVKDILILCLKEQENLEKINMRLEKQFKEINKMKLGSVALIEQITTVSKMRIYKPKYSHDLLHGVKFSNGALDKINTKIKELYLF